MDKEKKRDIIASLILGVISGIIMFAVYYANLEQMIENLPVLFICCLIGFIFWFWNIHIGTSSSSSSSCYSDPHAEAHYYGTDFATGQTIAQLKDLNEKINPGSSYNGYDAHAEAHYHDTNFAQGEIIAQLKNLNNNLNMNRR